MCVNNYRRAVLVSILGLGQVEEGGGGWSFADAEKWKPKRVDLCKEQQPTERILDSAAREGLCQVYAQLCLSCFCNGLYTGKQN